MWIKCRVKKARKNGISAHVQFYVWNVCASFSRFFCFLCILMFVHIIVCYMVIYCMKSGGDGRDVDWRRDDSDAGMLLILPDCS